METHLPDYAPFPTATASNSSIGPRLASDGAVSARSGQSSSPSTKHAKPSRTNPSFNHQSEAGSDVFFDKVELNGERQKRAAPVADAARLIPALCADGSGHLQIRRRLPAIPAARHFERDLLAFVQ